MSENKSYIPNRLKNASKEHPYVAGAVDIIDDRLNRDQQDINEDTYRKNETYSKEQLNNLITTPEQEYVTVTADDQTVDVTDVLPETGEADTVYRVGNWDGEQYDPTVYSEYAWDGTQYQFLSKKQSGIDDIPIPNSANVVKSGGVAKKPIMAYTRGLVLEIDNNTISFTPTREGSGIIVCGIANTYYVGHSIEDSASYTLSGSQVLVINNSNEIEVKNTPALDDIVLFGRDNIAGICYGMLFSWYQYTKILEDHNVRDCAFLNNRDSVPLLFNVDTGKLTIPSDTDVYTTDLRLPFFRTVEAQELTISGASNSIVFDIKEEVFSVGEITEGKLLVGFVKVNKPFINGFVTIQYSDGNIVKNHMSKEDIDYYAGLLVNPIEKEIKDADFAFSNPVPVSFQNARNGYYLDKNTAEVIEYSGYSISAPILLNVGDVIKGQVSASDVCVLAETDEEGSEYTKIISVDSVGTYSMEYAADREMYVAICYRTSTAGTSTMVAVGNYNYTLEDIAKQVANSGSSDNIPSFVYEESKTAFKRFQKWKGSDECLVFPILTDLHSTVNDDKEKAIRYLIATDKVFGYHFIANLGDVGISRSTASESDALAILDKVSESFNAFYGRTLYTVGNHDIDQQAEFDIKPSDCMNYLGQPTFNRYPDEFVIDNSHQCYYVDYSKLKVRVICINTSDKEESSGYSMTSDQFFWIYDALRLTPTGYSIVILSHFCVSKIGEWLSYISDSDYAYGSTFYLQKYADMLSAFANRSSIVVGSQTLDFSGVDASVKLIGNLCGDSHFDAQLEKDGSETVLKKIDGVDTPFVIYGNGVNYVITQSYGFLPNGEKPDWAAYTEFDYNSQVLIDVVAIKPSVGAMKLFRIGAGGSAMDREFTF